ncbi:hypothetical protein [Embleya sp. NPDC059237]|uniref:hypothetical protein n=1 Tax=Embleya sp. NPDC059237 TaxID=3346784 RepID=UPI00369B355A
MTDAPIEHDFRYTDDRRQLCVHCELPHSWWSGESCPGTAPPRPDPMPVVRVPHCPRPQRIKSRVRYDPASWYLQEVCDCPHDPDAALWRVHWVAHNGREMHCPCGPRMYASDIRETPGGGYACFDCKGRLPDRARGRFVVVDMLCCYCEGVAKAGRGVVVNAGTHQELAPARPAST